MIYVAISGTYTPVLLTVVGGWLDGWSFVIMGNNNMGYSI